jgi:hypothetical protein
MDIKTKFNVGDIVYYLTQDLIDDDGVCECCGRKNPGHFGPVYAVQDSVRVCAGAIRVFIGQSPDEEGNSVVEIIYTLENSREGYGEKELFATEEEALASGGKND